VLGWLAMAALLSPAQAARRLRGDMPQFANAPVAANPDGSAAPVPDPDAHAPLPTASDRPSLVPALTNRLSGGTQASQGYSPGSAYSGEMDRKRGDLGTNIGSILAPGLRLVVPLK
jgi:hypothetical protein